MANLREAGLLSLEALRQIAIAELEAMVRPAGYFRQKSARLKNFVRFLDESHEGSLDRMLTQPTQELREELLALNGVGPETADSILLYAGNHPVFVVDAYTRRILHRHGLVAARTDYEEIRELWETALVALAEEPESRGRKMKPEASRYQSDHPPSSLSAASRPRAAQIFNEMHALIVGVGKDYCRKSKPLCEACPLACFLPPRGPKPLEEPL